MHALTEDAVLLCAIAQSDIHAFEQLYHRHWHHLFIAAYNVLKDKAACEDIVQEVFLQVWKRRETIHIETTLEAYLHSIVRYSVFRHIKKEQVGSRLFEQLTSRMYNATPEDITIEKNIHSHIAGAVSNLPVKCREIYRLSREEQLTHHEIATRLNISTKTVENHISIALKKIRFTITKMAGLF
jgi:RNA polymerase sigma-70 factor (family 1)